jgi:hypothetical protein
MKRKFLLAFLLGVLVGGFVAGRPVVAQTAQRLFGTFNGAAKAVLVDSSGRLRVVGS